MTFYCNSIESCTAYCDCETFEDLDVSPRRGLQPCSFDDPNRSNVVMTCHFPPSQQGERIPINKTDCVANCFYANSKNCSFRAPRGITAWQKKKEKKKKKEKQKRKKTRHRNLTIFETPWPKISLSIFSGMFGCRHYLSLKCTLAYNLALLICYMSVIYFWPNNSFSSPRYKRN